MQLISSEHPIAKLANTPSWRIDVNFRHSTAENISNTRLWHVAICQLLNESCLPIVAMLTGAGSMGIFRRSDRFKTATIFVVAALLATALRVAVIDNDLWLDEVWSVQHAASIESPAEIFVSLHHDNNHHRNTLWLWLCGPDAGPVQQRLLSLFSGIVAVLLTGVLVFFSFTVVGNLPELNPGEWLKHTFAGQRPLPMSSISHEPFSPLP